MKTHRLLARALDYSFLYALLLTPGLGFFVNSILFLLLPLIFAPLEALSYYLLKTTPGKWLLGIKLRNSISLRSSFRLSGKKALLVLPLFFPPLNILFAMFYIKEKESFKYARWTKFETIELVKSKRHPFLQSVCTTILIVSFIFHFTPGNYRNDLSSLAKGEFIVENWVEVKDNDLKFSILFPQTPDIEHKEIPVTEHKTTLSVKEYKHEGNISYNLVSTKVPSSWTLLGSKYLLNALKKEISNYQGKVVESTFVKHDGYPAMTYLVQNHDSGQTKGILILVGKSLYKLEVEGKKDLSQDEIAHSESFIASFHIK